MTSPNGGGNGFVFTSMTQTFITASTEQLQLGTTPRAGKIIKGLRLEGLMTGIALNDLLNPSITYNLVGFASTLAGIEVERMFEHVGTILQKVRLGEHRKSAFSDLEIMKQGLSFGQRRPEDNATSQPNSFW